MIALMAVSYQSKPYGVNGLCDSWNALHTTVMHTPCIQHMVVVVGWVFWAGMGLINYKGLDCEIFFPCTLPQLCQSACTVLQLVANKYFIYIVTSVSGLKIFSQSVYLEGILIRKQCDYILTHLLILILNEMASYDSHILRTPLKCSHLKG